MLSFPESRTQKQIWWLILSDSGKWFFPRIQSYSEKDAMTKKTDFFMITVASFNESKLSRDTDVHTDVSPLI